MIWLIIDLANPWEMNIMNIKKYFILVFFMVGIFLAVVGGVLTAHYVLSDQIDEPEDSVEEALEKPTSDKKVNILIMGTDKGGERSDVMILASLDPRNKRLNMLSIPRDTRVKIGNNYQKINAALAIGREKLAIQTVKQLTGIPIHYYATIDFAGFRNIIDILGGVEFDVPMNMNYDDPVQDLHIHLKKGLQVLDGNKAEQFVRFRQYPRGDLDRIEAQQKFLKALFEQKLKLSYISKADDIYNEIVKSIKTNFKMSDLIKNIGAIKALNTENITMLQLPGEPKMIGGVSYFICNNEEMTKLIREQFGY